ncbi:MAG: hypothetical protein Q8O56_05735 [Solirubrobacteraceae bacterium]|nr:hypothetical protein [Solirubrobacteraceae bacterium]
MLVAVGADEDDVQRPQLAAETRRWQAFSATVTELVAVRERGEENPI